MFSILLVGANDVMHYINAASQPGRHAGSQPASQQASQPASHASSQPEWSRGAEKVHCILSWRVGLVHTSMDAFSFVFAVAVTMR